ncbi:MAG: TonB-dependent receptor [Acidobacteriaceae bacterium]
MQFRNIRCIRTAVTFAMLLGVATAIQISQPIAFAQETTGGIQGTVKDPAGAVVPGAQIVLTGDKLVGQETSTTDGAGYYHFSELPPGLYDMVVSATGFETLKRTGLHLEVGHLPTVNLALTVGKVGAVVQVSGATPLIDTTTTVTQTNLTEKQLNSIPRGISFQSVIQFAPAASNEPLMGAGEGGTMGGNGTGGMSPGSMANGQAYGYSIAGGSDSENSYLVEGQETANIIGGFSHTNVPFDFIQEVQVKTSGIDAEYGGALGGVIDVIMKKGASTYHGSVFSQYENNNLDASPSPTPHYDPTSSGTPTSWGFIDPGYQAYQPRQGKTSDFLPGFTFGGPVLPNHRNRLFFELGFNPEFQQIERFVNFPTQGGVLPFSQNTQTYYYYGRVDAAVTQKIRVFGSYISQGQRQWGEALPEADSLQGFYNPSSSSPVFAFSHNLGYSAPNNTTNVGADITFTPSIVSNTRFGYYFENYHDDGYPTTGTLFLWATNGVGATDAFGNPLPPSLQQTAGYINNATDINYTLYNANKAIQFDQDVSWYKSGFGGIHNFKFGYELNRLSNALDQHYNAPFVEMFVGNTPGVTSYNPQGPVGATNCANLEAADGTTDCQGRYGYISVFDYGSLGKATSYNHSIFAQDAWTIHQYLTLNLGIRAEREFLPGEAPPGGGVPANPINFGWGSKIAPRLGAAWDVLHNGKMKAFGSFGDFYDIMKLNLAISSFGGQYWQQCYYGLDTSDLASIDPVFNSGGRYCVGPNSSSEANFSGGVTPTGLTFLENQNFRTFPTTCPTCFATEEGVAPGLKPYEQHESTLGFDYQLSRTSAVEVRWDRRRLDHVIEDSAIFNPLIGETFVIVNPGQGVNSTFSGFCSFLYGAAAATGCSTTSGVPAPPNKTIPAARSYDGLEVRFNKTTANHWYAMVSYTYSHFRGNYTGLTSSDLMDGGIGGRNAPNNSRSFDEPYFSWNSMGGSSSGLLPTDRPNKIKGDAYYEISWLRKFDTTLGLFQYFYQGSPQTTYEDVGYGGSAWGVDLFNRGVWANITQQPNSGVITVGPPHVQRMPWYIQSDFDFTQSYNLHNGQNIAFSATFTNLLNEHAVTARYEQADTAYGFEYLTPNGQFIGNGPNFYSAAMRPYNVAGLNNSSVYGAAPAPITINSQYGQPLYWQLPRTIRLQLRYTF